MIINGIEYEWCSITVEFIDKETKKLLTLLQVKSIDLIYGKNHLPVGMLNPNKEKLHPNTLKKVMEIDRNSYFLFNKA